MATTVFFSSIMAVIIWFFVVSCGTLDAASVIYAFFLLFIFVRMMGSREISKYRRIFQVVFAVFFAISFIGNLIDERGSMSIVENQFQNSETPFCQIVLPLMVIPYALTKTVVFPARMIGHYASVVSMLLIWFIATLTLGRGWCSWVCFYGGWEDGFSRLAKKPRLQVLSRNKDIRSFQYAFLLFLVLVSIAFMSSVYCEWFCPFKLVTEFSPVIDIPSLIAAVFFIGAFLALVVVLPILTRKRFQCSSFCPFGAFQSLADRVSGYRIAIDTDKCTGCLKCAQACPFCAIDRETIVGKKGRPELTCAKCGECVSACPSGAIRYEFAFALRKGGKDRPAGHCARPEPKGRLGRFFQSLLEPQNLFVFSAFTFGTIISSSFVPDALRRIARLVAGGL